MSDECQIIEELFNELEVPRTPKEMHDYFYQVFDAVQNNESLQKDALLKKGLWKKFLEEFYPLYCFSQSRFCEKDSKLNIILGNQGYDAILKNSDGSKKIFEITSFINGEKDHKNALKMNKDGILFINTLSEAVHDNYKKKIIQNLNKKSLKDYNDINLLLVIDTSLYFEVIDRDSSDFINELIDEIKKIKFSFREIFLLHEVGNTKYNIDKHIFKIK